jgi:hypothetical protein
MQTDNSGINFPKIRNEVKVVRTEAGYSLEYGHQSCDIEIDEINHANWDKVIKALSEGTKTVEELQISYPSLEGSIRDLTNEFDRLGLLTEGKIEPVSNVMSGITCFDKIRTSSSAAIDNALKFRKLTDGLRLSDYLNKTSPNKDLVIGYACEYYYLVRHAPRILGAAVATSPNTEAFEILRDFLSEEIYHDKMLSKALSAVKVTPELLNPLPSTLSVINSLKAWAFQHPPSLWAVLFLLEVPQHEFNAKFKEGAERAVLPNTFWQPFMTHSDVNEDGGHEDISRRLMATMSAVSEEENVTIKKNFIAFLEMLIWQEAEIISWYGKGKGLRTMQSSEKFME